MKILYKLLFIVLLLFNAFDMLAQMRYNFSAVSTGVFTPISGTTVAAVKADDAASAALPIGFTFNFNGTNYTQLYANSNGTLNLSAASADRINDFATGAGSPLIAPLWDDIDGVASGTATYTTTGTAPFRVFTFEWLNWEWNYTANAATISFQAKLYETSNIIEFVYRQEAAAVASGSASIGLMAAAGTYISLNGTGTAPIASTSTNTTTLATKPATGQMYRFTPYSTTPSNLCGNTMYVSTSGTGDGYLPSTPCSLPTALATAAVNTSITTIEMLGGNYTYYQTLDILSNVAIIGGYEDLGGGNWRKNSAQATSITINPNNEVISASVSHVIGLRGLSKTNFKLQDLTITTGAASGNTSDGSGKSNYAVYLNACSAYDITRCSVTSGAGTAGTVGSNGNNGSSGSIGADGSTGGCGLGNSTGGTGGNGGSGGGGGNGAAGADGSAGSTGGYGGGGGSDNGTTTSNTTVNQSNGNWNGYKGATGGGSSGGGGGNGGARSSDGSCGNNAGVGAAGANASAAGAAGTDGTTVAATYTIGYYTPSYGTAGTGGTGGSGGGGGGGGGGDDDFTDVAGDGGKGGGGGGGGGEAATGAQGSGASSAVFLYNNGTGSTFTDVLLTAGAAGAAISGGTGGLGGAGSAGYTAISCGCGDGNDGGAGGTGSTGGRGGNGGSANAGTQLALASQGSGTSPTLSGTATINSGASGGSIPNATTLTVAPQVLCTNSEITAVKGAGTWTLGSGLTFVNDATSSLSTYTTSSPTIVVAATNTGNYALSANGSTYNGFVPVRATRTLPTINSITFPICTGGSITLGTPNNTVATAWEWAIQLGTVTSTTNPTPIYTSTVQNPGAVTINTPGTYQVRLRVKESCCGWSTPVYTTFTVVAQPTLAPTGGASACGGTVSSTLAAGLSGGAGTITYQWQKWNDVTPGWVNETGTGNTTASYAVTATTPSMYRVTVTASASGCAGANSLPVTLYPYPTPSPTLSLAPTTTTLCAGTPVALTAGGGAQYQFYVNGSSVQGPNTTNTYNFTPTNSNTTYVTASNALVFDGNVTAIEWGTPIATSNGGPANSTGFGAGHELNALYVRGDATNINFGIAGNVTSGNRILLFIDSKSGGYNNGSFSKTSAPAGVSGFNAGTTFDTGFNPDYCLVIGTNGSGTYFNDLFTLAASGVNTFLGNSGAPGLGANPANSDNTRGFELAISKTNLGYTSGNIQLMAMYISDAGFLNNKFLTHANSGDGNYGSGAVTFGSAAPNPITIPAAALTLGNCSANSSTSTFTVVAQPTLSSPSLTNSTICIGGSTAISTSPSGGTGTFNYQWQYSANGATGWANVATGTPAAFTYTNATSAILNIATTNSASAATVYYRCLLTTNIPAGAGCAATSANGVLTVVADPTSPSVSTKSPNVTSVCAGATLTTSVPTGGNAGVGCTLEYRYTQDGGTSFSAPSSTLPTLTATATGYHAIEVRRNNCLSGCDQPSTWQEIARWTVIADPAIGGTTQPTNPICPGGTGTFTVSATGGTDGSGATVRTQQWQYSANGSTGWTDVVDGTPAGILYGGTGTSTSLTASTTNAVTPAGTYYYRCIVGATGTDCGSITSATLSMTVNAEAAPPTATMSPATACVGTTLTLINPTLGTGGAGTQSFEYSITGLTGSFSATVPSITAVVGSNSIWIRTNPGGLGCNTSSATQYTWTVPVIPTATAPSAQSYCNSVLTSAIALTGTPSGVTFNVSGGASIGLANQTGITTIPAFTPITGSATVSITPVANGCTGTAVTYNITVNPRPTATTCKTDDPCQTLAGTIKVQIAGGTPLYTITYSPAGTPASPIITSAASTTISGLAGGQTYNFVVTDANGCIAP